MVLARGGSVNIYVGDAEGGDVKQLTFTAEDNSSPCWSPDGRWICFASKVNERRALSRVPAEGGPMERIHTDGISNPSEPDWSPDGRWIAFTSQYLGGFNICVVPSEGGTATPLVSGEDPSWAPNSRTLIFVRRGSGGNRTLSLLDVPTKQVKDVPRVSGSSNSQPSWAR
jgi:TolB protein